MQVRQSLPAPRINDDLLHFVFHTPWWFWAVAGLFGLLVLAAGVTEGLMIDFGLQVLGLNNVTNWAVLIANFIFWVGISHAGVMISSILRLTEAEWRRPITRSAEVLAAFSLATAGLFPLIHTGRIWRTIYWIFPYDFTRNVWPNVRSALIWDPSAIVTYLTGTILFIYVDLIPDLAVARDRAGGRRRTIYGALALGFRGTTRQWQIQRRAGQLLSAIILAVFVSVHSIVAWDLAMAIVPGWHSTIMAPYFVIGAVHSGVAAVVTAMCALRVALKIPQYITDRHLETIGRLEIAVWFGYVFFFLMDMYFELFDPDPVGHAIWQLRFFTPPTNILFFVQVLTAIILPLPIWLQRRLRSRVGWMFWASISVNIGMWLERYYLVVNPLSYKQPFVFTWVDPYVPRPAEYIYTIGAIAIVAGGLLLFAKLLPIIPIWDIKEGQVLKEQVRLGRVLVPAIAREE